MSLDLRKCYSLKMASSPTNLQAFTLSWPWVYCCQLVLERVCRFTHILLNVPGSRVRQARLRAQALRRHPILGACPVLTQPGE